MPVPWLQVKLLRLLQYYSNIGKRKGGWHKEFFFPFIRKYFSSLSEVDIQLLTSSYLFALLPFYSFFYKNFDMFWSLYFKLKEDQNVRIKLTTVLQSIISNGQEIPKNIQHNNAQNAVLFEAINLAIHLDPESELVIQASILLGKFIQSKETNIRYLGLETMAHLAGFAISLDQIKKHQEVIIQSLKDKDISVRRRALDLLYSMCDKSNSRTIVSELLHYLTVADYAIREEMVLKIAILTEKFADDQAWYVDVILQLISNAGDHVSDDVWYRVVQIVTNSEELQEYVAKTVLAQLKSPTCHENALKVGGYILGEYGHLIANRPGCSPIEQFTSLHNKFHMCTESTRALLLTTYLKFVNLFPEIKSEIIKVFKQLVIVLDVELQQRASEYLAICSLPTDDLLQTVCEEMPPFSRRENALLNRLNKKIDDTEDKRTWHIGGLDANKDKDQIIKRTDKRRQSGQSKSVDKASGVNAKDQSAPLNTSSKEAPKVVDLIGLDADSGPLVLASTKESDISSNSLSGKLLTSLSGVLFEDQVLQIGIKSEFSGHYGRLAIFFGNKLSSPITNLGLDMNPHRDIRFSLTRSIDNLLPPGAQLSALYDIECIGCPQDFLSLKVWLETNSPPLARRMLNLKLPISLARFISPVELNASDFFSRWKQIGPAPKEAQIICKSPIPINLTNTKSLMAGLNFMILDTIDPNPNNVIGAGIFTSSSLGKIGCLFRLEPNQDQQVFCVLTHFFFLLVLFY